LGTSASVSRALKLISESALDDSGVETLEERLGLGSRHLRRLFLRYLGATPVAVAQTRRGHFAKKLIEGEDGRRGCKERDRRVGGGWRSDVCSSDLWGLQQVFRAR